MSRISSCLNTLNEQNKKALVTYIVNGDPRPSVTLDAMHALVEAGTDIIEIGVPFSDPMAEGPTIQRAHERALEHNISLNDTLELVARFRQNNTTTPIVIMGYANPIERKGYAQFAQQAAKAGVDGLITVDLPPEESTVLNTLLAEQNIDPIFLIAPTTSDKRMAQIVKEAKGFIYYVSLKGVTGAGHLDADSVCTNVARIRQVSALPIMVGFGIKDAQSAKTIAQYAQGVVVGSAIVDLMQAHDSDDVIINAIKTKTADVRSGIDATV